MAKELTREQKDAKNKRAKALRINKKVDGGYIPDPEEKKLLIDENLWTEESAEPEVVAELEEEGMSNDMDSLVESRVAEMKERPAIVRDGEVVEITGEIKYLWVDDECLNVGEVVIKDIDGDDHPVKIMSKGNVWGIFYQIDSKKYLNGMLPYENLSDSDRDTEIERLIQVGKTMVFRTVFDEDGNKELFAPVSLKYEKSKIEDLIPAIKDVLNIEDEEMQVVGSSGRWGGSALIKFNENKVSQFNVQVDGGILDGGHAISIKVGGMILACSNEMVMEVQAIVGKLLPNFNFGLRSVHSGDIEGFKEKLSVVKDEIEKFSAIIEEAKLVILTKEERKNILQFYVKKGVLSEKTITIIERTILDDNSIQQVPGTLWGLAMVLTYAGTHCEFKKGVKYALKKTGGELLCVSGVWKEYMELVEDTIKEEE